MEDTIKRHPRLKPSQNQLCSAFMELINEKTYDSITIKEICNRAGVIRENFYRDFKSKEEIIQLILEQKAMEFLQLADTISIGNTHQLLILFLKHCQEIHLLLKVLVDNRMLFLLFGPYAATILPAVGQEHSMAKENGEQNYLPALWKGGLLGMIDEWVKNGYKTPPEILSEIFIKHLRY